MSNENLPEPLTPPDCDLRGLEWMPLHGNKLLGSDFDAIASDAGYRAAHRLWWAAWQQQVPAASLPDDDRVLAHIAGYQRDQKSWLKIKEIALHGFIKCSDGRLYHKFLSEEAVVAYEINLKKDEKRTATRERLAKWRDAKRLKAENKTRSNLDCNASRNDNVTRYETDKKHECNALRNADVTSITVQNSTEHNYNPPIPPKPSAVSRAGRGSVCDDPDFEKFWQAYPRKIGKGQARRAWATALKKTKADHIISAISCQKFDPCERFQPHPATWLNGERWLDEQAQGDPVLRAAGVDILENFSPDPAWGLLQ